ncbi:MAG: hypothetical protein HY550_11730 [Elusimicrobia bacterium]|nr:hypothetical protein [Elusimicrobiota bacterium]
MKRFIFICAALALAFPPCGLAGEFKDKGETIAVDFPSGWNPGKSDDPTVTLKLEKGRSFFEFSRQDSELGDYYLKARVREQVDSLRGKGNQLSGDIKSVSLHGVSAAYYTSYESMGADSYIAFLTYNGVSYAVSARGLPDGDFRSVLSSVRKPGEKIELPKPKKIRVVRKKKEKDEDEELLNAGEVPLSTGAVTASTDILNAFAVSTVPAVVESSTQGAAAAAGEAAHTFLSELARKQEENVLPPYIPRKPLPLLLWAALIGVWVAGSFAARSAAEAYTNPKLPPPPADVPPDFFFPFVISRFSTVKETTYNVLTRQRQLLLAEFPYEHELYVAGSVYGCLSFHVAWSLLGFIGRGDAVLNALAKFPLLGRAFASLPEIFFIVPFVIGLSIYFGKERSLQVMDAQSAPVMAVHPETKYYALIRDGAGKEVARLVRKGTFLNRYWEFVDTDDLVVFSIRDDFPRGFLLRKLFGNLGGKLRSHYGIFVQERRAGFIFLDPTSSDRFQIHMDYAFARLGHPAQILAAVLYVISREKDPIYPSPF